jgi:hypothetical protein
MHVPNASSQPVQMVLTSGPGMCYVPYCPSSYGFGKKYKSLKTPKGLDLTKNHHIMFAVPSVRTYH